MPSWASVTVGQASVVWSAIASFRWLSGECLASLLQSTIYTTSIRVRFTNQHWCYWNHQFKAIASFRQLSDECQQISVTRTNSQNTRFLSNTPTDGFGVRITDTQRFVIFGIGHLPNNVLTGLSTIMVYLFCTTSKTLGNTSWKKECFLSGIARITSPPPPHPISGNLYIFIWTSKPTFCAYDRRNTNYHNDGPMIIMMVFWW